MSNADMSSILTGAAAPRAQAELLPLPAAPADPNAIWLRERQPSSAAFNPPIRRMSGDL